MNNENARARHGHRHMRTDLASIASIAPAAAIPEPSLFTMALAVQSEDGSLASRFANGIASISTLRTRFHAEMDRVTRIRRQQQQQQPRTRQTPRIAPAAASAAASDAASAVASAAASTKRRRLASENDRSSTSTTASVSSAPSVSSVSAKRLYDYIENLQDRSSDGSSRPQKQKAHQSKDASSVLQKRSMSETMPRYESSGGSKNGGGGGGGGGGANNAGVSISSSSGRVLELPETHALLWVHEFVDWTALFDETSRLYAIAQRRLLARKAGRSHAEAVHAHPTGWTLFDDSHRTAPSAVGEALRRVWHRSAYDGSDPDWHLQSVSARVDARLTMLKDRSSRASSSPSSHARRLFEAFFEGTVAAPFTFYDTFSYGSKYPKSDVTFWEAALRYIIGSTIDCYFTNPAFEPSQTQGGTDPSVGDDGDTLKILRPSSEKLCFPAIPMMLPKLGTFRQVTNTHNVDLYELTYEAHCTRDGASQAVARVIEDAGFNASSEDALLPNAGLLRTAEAVDAISNAARSGNHGQSTTESAGYILCSIVELGGVLYVLFCVTIALILLSFLPCVNFAGMLCFDTVNASVALSSSSEKPGVNTKATIETPNWMNIEGDYNMHYDHHHGTEHHHKTNPLVRKPRLGAAATISINSRLQSTLRNAAKAASNSAAATKTPNASRTSSEYDRLCGNT